MTRDWITQDKPDNLTGANFPWGILLCVPFLVRCTDTRALNAFSTPKGAEIIRFIGFIQSRRLDYSIRWILTTTARAQAQASV